MSVTAPPEPIQLTQDQADHILTYAVEHKMYETGTGGLDSVDPQARVNDAATLAFQARRAYVNGNQSEAVKEVLSIAQVDMTPAEQQPAVAPSPVVAAPVSAASNGGDPYMDSTDEQLHQALQAFMSVPPSPAVQAEIDRVQAVLTQRSQASAQATTVAQEVAPSAQPAAPPPAPGPVPPESVGQPTPSAAVPVAAPAPVFPAVPLPHTPPAPVDLPPVPGLPRSGVISPGGVPDSSGAPAQPPPPYAGAVPGPQALQSSPQGVVPAPPTSAQDGASAEVASLLPQLTWDMMTAYGLTIETARALSADQLRQILASPGGPQPVAVSVPASVSSAVSPEREALEGRVTGPMLKAWRRGRKDVPDLSDEDLKIMVEYPGGQSTLSQGESFLDLNRQSAEAPVVLPPAAMAQEVSPQPPVSAPPAVAQQVLPLQAALVSRPVQRPPSGPAQVGDAMAIIAREHLPVPPEVDDPYRLPNDVSQASDAELWSLHARAHAVEARVNWVISERDDEVGDLERLLGYRRVVVRNEMPKSEDGKRLTKDDVEARIDGDEQVIALAQQVATIQKGTNKLKVIRDNAHRDCERLSRQWSFRSKEENFSPTR